MAFYNRQTLEFEREEDWGFAIAGGLRAEYQKAAGDLYFKKLDEPLPVSEGDFRGSFRFAEVYLQLSYSPGQTYINSKQRRTTANRDAPIFKLKHTMGIKGLFGGQYNYHVTEASIYYRQWLKSWGKMDLRLKGGRQWSQVPFPLLIAPAANVSYIWQPETFELINNMEFLNDKYVSFMMEWDFNGKIFNRIPFLRDLQWRELQRALRRSVRQEQSCCGCSRRLQHRQPHAVPRKGIRHEYPCAVLRAPRRYPQHLQAVANRIRSPFQLSESPHSLQERRPFRLQGDILMF